MTAAQRYVARHRALGLCLSCSRPAAPHRTRCAICLRRYASRVMRYYRPKGRFRVTRAMLLANIQATAARLQVRHLTLRDYDREGSFSPNHKLFKRLEVTWGQLCAWAGLTSGHHKIHCQRCRRKIRRMGPAHRYCRACRWILRKRTDVLRWGEEVA